MSVQAYTIGEYSQKIVTGKTFLDVYITTSVAVCRHPQIKISVSSM